MSGVQIVVNHAELDRIMSPHGQAGTYLRGHIGPPIVAEMQARAAVDTGRMQASCRVTNVLPSPVGCRIDIGPTAVNEQGTYYPIFVEFGTRFMAAQPFIRPALSAIYR